MKAKPFILLPLGAKALRTFSLSVLAAGILAIGAFAQTSTAPPATPAGPPSAAPERSQADLEKLVAPIALYPDPLIATLLPASAYPLEVVQAARFVKDTNNIPKLDAQPWDDNVKAVAKFPEVINQMNDNIAWTSDLGDAFINQPKEVMDAIQTMRGKAKDSGALQTTPQQVVVVTNTVVTNTVANQIVYVTNQVVQIQPSQPEVIYVPQYSPTVVYPAYPPYPAYYYPPPAAYAGAAVVSFGVGLTVGAIIGNNCDWGHGGCYNHSDVDVDIDRNVNRERNVNRNVNENRNVNANNRGQKWQPDQNRLKNSGSTMSSAQSREARGWSSASATPRNTSATPRAGQTGPSAANRPSSSPNVNRPSSSPSANRPSSSPGSSPSANRPSSSPSVNRPSSSPSVNRSSAPSASQRSAFSGGGGGGGGGGAQARQASARGAASRGGGGGRGGGGRR